MYCAWGEARNVESVFIGGPSLYPTEWSSYEEGAGVPGDVGTPSPCVHGAATLVGATGLTSHTCAMETPVLAKLRRWFTAHSRSGSNHPIPRVGSPDGIGREHMGYS